jgi:hypothetical protein
VTYARNTAKRFPISPRDMFTIQFGMMLNDPGGGGGAPGLMLSKKSAYLRS